jgi:enoyl-CoA hydratase
MARNSPLSMACAVDLIHRVRGRDTIEGALELEYRFTGAGDGAWRFPRRHPRRDHRQGPAPNWRHATTEGPSNLDVSRMLLPLGAEGLKL